MVTMTYLKQFDISSRVPPKPLIVGALHVKANIYSLD